MTTKLAHCAPVPGTMGHRVGHNKYIEILRILLYPIYIFFNITNK